MKYFYKNIVLEVPESVYFPEEDSELLASVIEKSDFSAKRVLEMGCGSGLLSILAAKQGSAVTAVDANPVAVDATKGNAARNDVPIHVFESDLFQKVDGVFDAIIFNPPYLPSEDDDRTYAGGQSGRDTIERFAAGVKDHLEKNGTILMLISSLTGEEETAALLEKNGFSVAVAARKKIPWEELIVLEATAR
jgi:release factor glutamine methyltransferase